MIVIVYRTNYTILAKDTYQRLEIREVGFCYLLSNSQDMHGKQEDVLSELLHKYHHSNTIFIIPEMLKGLFIELFWRINSKEHLVRGQYDNNDLGRMKKTGAIKNEIIKYIRIKNPSPTKINFVEIWRLSEMSPAITKGENNHFLDNKMKIVRYKADKDVPFGTAYNQLGSTDKIIFSNRQDKITDFNNKSVDELRHLIEPWLPKQKMIGSKENDTIFYVPYDMWNKFIEILEQLISSFKKMMGMGKISSIPKSPELGLGKESSLASFYDDMEIQEVQEVQQLGEYDVSKENLQKLFDEIAADENNEVDAIFITAAFNAPKPILIQSQSKDSNKPVDIPSFGKNIAQFAALRKKMDPGQAGLKHALFHFNKGITSITRLGKKKQVLLFMVSTAEDVLADVELCRGQNLEEIGQLIKDIGWIDDIDNTV
jgi:hypothetical protein